MATTTTHRPSPKPYDLDITIVSAKHLKNVNWRNGDLSPYAIFWLDPDRRLATKSDDSNSTKPVWNERFLIPLPSTPDSAVLTLEIFHSRPSDTPKPLVGSLRLPFQDIPDPSDSNWSRTFELRRPSGRPSGKIRLKLAIRDRPLPDYQITPPPPYYYTTAPPRYPSSTSQYNSSSLPSPPPPAAVPPSPSPPPPSHPYHYGTYTDPYSGYYQGGYYSQPPTLLPPRPFIERQFTYGGGSGGPSAPVDYAQFEQKPRTSKKGSGAGLATGLGVGAIAGGLGGLAIDEGLRHEEEKFAERVESDLGSRELDDYSEYRRVDY